MPVPDPPFLTPRIMKVLEPSAGQYEVVVRMDPTTASRFPDKPFGTAIDQIGLAPKDSAKYEGYTLVSIEPADKGGKDHLWIFQKLSGPEWTTTSKSKDNLTPAKYRGQTVVVKTEQEVAPDALPTELTGDLVSSVVAQSPNSGKAVLTEITETIDESAAALIGQQAYEQRQVVDTSESLVVDGVAALAGLNAAQKALIVSASVNPIGNGKSVKQVVSVTAWDTHTEKIWDNELQTHVSRTEQFVPVSALSTPAGNTDYKIVNTDRALKVTTVPPTDKLNSFYLSYPVKLRLDLPRVLKAVSVVWNEGEDIGQRFNQFGNTAFGSSFSLSGDNADTDKSSASLMPEILTEFEDFSTDNLFATAYVFYMPLNAPGETPTITQATILARLTALAGAPVSMWPVFRTKSHTIVGLGQSASVQVSTNASNNFSYSTAQGITKSGWQQGYGDDISKNLSNSAAQIAPCIHGLITIAGQTSRTKSVTASASSPIYSSYMQSLTPTHTRAVTVVASVSPTSLAATTPASIPISGRYLVDSKVQPAEHNYAKVYAEVFDAADLVPPA